MKVLLVEDEPKTARSICRGFEENQIEVDVAYDGLLALSLARKNSYDVIVTDIIMPNMSGLEFCQQVRSSGSNTPILMLSALGSTDEKVQGFEAGADDYMVKPFEFKELLARINALTKRGGYLHTDTNVLRFEDLELNINTKTASRAGKKIELTGKEFALLEYLMRNQGRVIPKAEIAEKVWDINFETGTNVIEVYVNYLRKKIDKDFEPKLIHTQFGMGYILKKE